MSGGLTGKQEAFVLAYAESGNVSEAYRRAYDSAKMKPESVNRKAHDMINNVKIMARVNELRRAARSAAVLTLESHLRDLLTLRDEARKAGQLSAAISAEVARGKVAGLYVSKQEVIGPLEPPRIVVNFVKPERKDDDDSDDCGDWERGNE